MRRSTIYSIWPDDGCDAAQRDDERCAWSPVAATIQRSAGDAHTQQRVFCTVSWIKEEMIDWFVRFGCSQLYFGIASNKTCVCVWKGYDKKDEKNK